MRPLKIKSICSEQHMGAQSSSDSSIREFSQTVVPYWNLVMDAFCGHIYLFIFFFFFEAVSWEGGGRKEDQRLWSEFAALCLGTVWQRRDLPPHTGTNEIRHPQLCFPGEVFPFSPGKGRLFPTKLINTFCCNKLFVLSVLKWRNPVWKEPLQHCPRASPRVGMMEKLGFCVRGSLGSSSVPSTAAAASCQPGLSEGD